MNAGDQPKNIQQVVLLAAPWPLFNRPSIQIAALKAYLNQHLPDIQTHAWHLFLNIAENIGYKTYQALSQRTWLAETVYAALLYPDRTHGIEKLYRQYASQAPELQTFEFGEIAQAVKKATHALLQRKNWEQVDLVGFSVSLCQMTASLYLMSEIKKINPNIRVVIGGTTFCGPSARDYLDHFTHIDFIVIGEGENSLVSLIAFLNTNQESEAIPEIPGVVSRHTPKGRPTRFAQVPDLEKLPCPDFEDYFIALQHFSPEKRFFPTLPIEASRGCWWNGSGLSNEKTEEQTGHKSGDKDGCAFCNLNLQWKGYRTKTPQQVACDVDRLTTQHQTLSVAFVDNVMPTSRAQDPFHEIDKLHKDIRFFGEIRANTSLKTLQRMRSAGLQEVQVGIESLSAGLLKKMNKGTRVIQNLEIMKHCDMLGIENSSNLILGFPGSDENDVAETLEALEFAMLFQPLKPVHFWLGLESPVWRNYQKFNIKSIGNHPGYGVLFPKELVRNLTFIIQSYRGDRTWQRKAWRPVEKKVAQWHKLYAGMHAKPFSRPILSFQDGGTFLIIRQRQYKAEKESHRLTSRSREIYLFCQTNRSIKRILATFDGLSQEKLIPFLTMMVDKHLMFKENDRYLSLASPANYCPQ